MSRPGEYIPPMQRQKTFTYVGVDLSVERLQFLEQVGDLVLKVRHLIQLPPPIRNVRVTWKEI